MSEFDLIYCRPSRSHKAKRIFELSYSQNDYLALRLQKGLTFQDIRQNYRWLETTNEVTKKRGFVLVDAIEPVENYAQVMNPPQPAAQENLPLVRKASVPLRLSEFNLEEDTYVQFFGCDALERGTNALPIGHNLVNVFFLTPILCIHCKDYIWGRGRQGVSCSGEFILILKNLLKLQLTGKKLLCRIYHWSFLRAHQQTSKQKY